MAIWLGVRVCIQSIRVQVLNLMLMSNDSRSTHMCARSVGKRVLVLSKVLDASDKFPVCVADAYMYVCVGDVSVTCVECVSDLYY